MPAYYAGDIDRAGEIRNYVIALIPAP